MSGTGLMKFCCFGFVTASNFCGIGVLALKVGIQKSDDITRGLNTVWTADVCSYCYFPLILSSGYPAVLMVFLSSKVLWILLNVFLLVFFFAVFLHLVSILWLYEKKPLPESCGLARQGAFLESRLLLK